MKKPWDHASDYNPLLSFYRVEDVHSVLFGFFASLDFFTLAAASKKGGAEDVMRARADNWTALLRWSMANESNSISHFDRYVHDGCVYGVGFGFMPWMRRSRKMRAEVFLPEKLRRDDNPAHDSKLITAGLGPSLIDGPTWNDKQAAFRIQILDEDGEERDGWAWIERKNPAHPDGEAVLIVEREVVWYNAPRPINVAPWDMLVPPDVRDLQSAKRFWHRRYLSYGEVAEMKKRGMFNAMSREDLALLRDRSEARYPDVSASGYRSSDAVDAGRDAELGTQKVESRRDQYEVYFEYAYEDVDGDGIQESIVRAVLDFKGPMLLMRHNLEYLFPHGRRPFYDWHLFPIDHRYYGMGIPEVLEKTQTEDNAYYQARSDIIEVITKPGGFYDPMSGLAPSEIRYTPGMMIKVRDPQTAFTPLAFPVDPTHLIREQSGMEAEAERAIGQTDIGLGRQSSRPNAPRTLGGTALMVRQQQLRSDVYLKRLMFGPGEYGGGISEFLLQYRDLYAALMPPTKEFRALGTDEIREVSREDLQGRFDFVVDFGPEINNPQLRMQNSILRYQNSITNPLVMQDPDALWQVTVDMWEATGWKSAGRRLRKPGPMASHPPMEQDEEILVMSKGIYVEPLPADDHAAHLATITDLLNDQIKLAELFNPAKLALLEKHTAKHQEFMFAAANPVGAPPSSPPTNGGRPRPPRSMTSMSPYGPNQPVETTAGPIEMESDIGMGMQ